MRGVLCLLEGAATGAADGCAGRMAGRQAAACTSGRAWPMGWPTCTTRGAPSRPWSPWSATTRPTTSASTLSGTRHLILALDRRQRHVHDLPRCGPTRREGLDVTTVIFSNRCYAILAMELERVQRGGLAGEAARSLLDLSRPALDFTALAAGLGVPSDPGHHRG